jgi:maltose O-acetyltransferase
MKIHRHFREVVRSSFRLLLRLFADLEFEVVGRSKDPYFGRLWLVKKKVAFESPISLGHEIDIRHLGNLQFGARCAIGSFTRIWNYSQITIGDDFLGAGGLSINSATHDPATLDSIGKPIKIGNRVWIGLNVSIIAGVTIGDDVVIGAGSVVTKDIPSNSIAAGVPARVLKRLDRELFST